MSAAAAATRRRFAPRVRTRTVLQLEATECGAASLAMILAYWGRHVPLEDLRRICGISRDGSKASNLLKAAREFGLLARGFKKEPDQLGELRLPLMLFWNFNHFLVLEGFSEKGAHLNDPAVGRRLVSDEEFAESFTGVALAFEPGEAFSRGGRRPSGLHSLMGRISSVRSSLLFVFLASVALIAPTLSAPLFTRVFVDFVLVQAVRPWLWPLAGAIAGTAALVAALTLVQQVALTRLRQRMALHASARFVWHVLRLPVDYFAQRYAIEIAGRTALNDRLAILMSGELATTVLSLVALVAFALLMVQYDPVLTAITIAFALLNLASLGFVSRLLLDVSRRLQLDDGKLRAITVRGLSMIDTLKSTGSENLFVGRWAGYHTKVVNSEQVFGRVQVWLAALPVAAMGASGAVVLVVGGFRVMDGTISIGMLVGFQALLILFAQPVNRLVSFGGQIQEARADVERLDDVLRNELDPSFSVSGSTSRRVGGRLEIRDLRYGYGPLDPPLIEDFSLSLAPGERVALVGGSGSGKSTVGRLIAGLSAPWSGSVRLGGEEIGEIPRAAFRHSVAYVDQATTLFTGSVRDNITLWDTTLPDARVMAASADALIHTDIALRTGGYDHPVDEAGRNFSGGQRQRIVVARALARDPALLILDEATSALDAATEAEFMTRLRRRGCSCIIIAHRLSTIRDCDEIIVLDRGRILERGRHADLMGRNGAYKALIGT